MSLVLDELAEAILSVRTGRNTSLVSSLDLREQFTTALTPAIWSRLETALQVSLPPLIPVPETWLWESAEWELPMGLETISDLAMHLLEQGLEAPDDWPWEVTLYEWREAQIFVSVRGITSEQLLIPKSEIFRHSRFVEDLKAD